MRLLLEERRKRLERGERAIGWKVGFGTPAALESLGTRRALVGFLTDGSLLDRGARVSLAGWRNPMLEPEVAVHIAEDVDPAGGREALEAAVDGLGAAIELADVAPPPEDPERILAGNIYQRHVMLGPVDRGRRQTAGVTARVVKNDEEVAASREPATLTGEPLDVLELVVETLASFGERLRAGEVVITGSVVAPLAVAAGDVVRVELPPLGWLAVSFDEGGQADRTTTEGSP